MAPLISPQGVYNPLGGARDEATPLLLQPATWLLIAAAFYLGYLALKALPHARG
jgi:hypothetical protein